MQEIRCHASQKTSPLCNLFTLSWSKRSAVHPTSWSTHALHAQLCPRSISQRASTHSALPKTAAPPRTSALSLRRSSSRTGVKHPSGVPRTSCGPRTVRPLNFCWQFCQSKVKPSWVDPSQKQQCFTNMAPVHLSSPFNESTLIFNESEPLHPKSSPYQYCFSIFMF